METLKRNLIKKTLSAPDTQKGLRQWLTEQTGSSLREFSSFVCEKCNFLDDHGKLQVNNCELSLKALEAQGLISLQHALNYTPNPMC